MARYLNYCNTRDVTATLYDAISGIFLRTSSALYVVISDTYIFQQQFVTCNVITERVAIR